MTETIIVNGKVYSEIASNDEILDLKTFVKINSFITKTIKKNDLEFLKTENIIKDRNIVFQILSPDSIENTHFFTLSSILNREYKTYHLETFIDNYYTSDLSSKTDELSEDVRG